MTRLIRMILEHLWEETEIPEELLYEFTTKAMKIVQTRSAEQLSPDFWELERCVESFWRAQCFEYVRDEHIYEMGRLLSLTNMIAMMSEDEEKQRSLDEYASRFKDWYMVFKGMHDRPGITHKKLAELAVKSESSLSQFVNKNQWEGLYIYRRFGREKSYYLTELGQQLYELMKDNQPRPTEDKYARFLGVRNNIEDLTYGLMKDGSYKMVRSDEEEFLTSRIYAVNYRTETSKKETNKAELVAEIRFKKTPFKEKKEESEAWLNESIMRKPKVI